MNDIYLTRKQQKEVQVREEMQKAYSAMRVYDSDNKVCVALTQKYERMEIDPVLINKFKSFYQ